MTAAVRAALPIRCRSSGLRSPGLDSYKVGDQHGHVCIAGADRVHDSEGVASRRTW
jgi:hypothetical protein